MRIRTLHRAGLTNLCDAEVLEYERLASSDRDVGTGMAFAMAASLVLVALFAIGLAQFAVDPIPKYADRIAQSLDRIGAQERSLARLHERYTQLADRFEGYEEPLRHLERSGRELRELREFQDRLMIILGERSMTLNSGGPREVSQPVLGSVQITGAWSGDFLTTERASFAEAPARDDPSVRPLSIGQSAVGKISDSQPVQWFKIDVPTPSIVEFDINTSDGNFDSTLAVFTSGEESKQLAFNDDHGRSDSFIRLLLQPEKYLAGVAGYGDSTGDFELGVTRASRAPKVCGQSV